MNDFRNPHGHRDVEQRIIEKRDVLHVTYPYATAEALGNAAVRLIELENLSGHPSGSGSSYDAVQRRNSILTDLAVNDATEKARILKELYIETAKIFEEGGSDKQG